MEDAPHPPGHCPVCGVAVGLGPRYPHALCVPCRGRATDLAGRAVALHSGAGFFARFRDDGADCGQVTDDGRVLVDGAEYLAHEDYYGGVVVVWRPRPDQRS